MVKKMLSASFPARLRRLSGRQSGCFRRRLRRSSWPMAGVILPDPSPGRTPDAAGCLFTLIQPLKWPTRYGPWRRLETRPSSTMRHTAANRSGPISPCSKARDGCRRRGALTAGPGLSCASQEQPAEILAVADRAVEGRELVRARMQTVEVGDAVSAEQHGLAV